MERQNIETDLGMPGSPAGAETVSEPPGPEVLCNTSESGVIELPKQKQKWSQKENRMLWEAYVESDKETRGYMARMQELWKKKGGRDATTQRLRTQVQSIRNLNLITVVERGEIEQKVCNRKERELEGETEEAEADETGNGESQGRENENYDQVVIENAEGLERLIATNNLQVKVERCMDVVVDEKGVRPLTTEEQKVLRRVRELTLSNEKPDLPSLKKVNRKVLKQEVEMVNGIIHNITTETVTDMNNLLYAGAYFVCEKLGKINSGVKKQEVKEPWWKRRIQANLIEWRKDLSRLEERRKGNFEFQRKDLERLNRKYKLNDVGNNHVIRVLKEKIDSGATKIKRYERSRLAHKQNTLFSMNQKKFYEEIDGGRRQNAAPDAGEATEFWKGIWSNPGEMNEEASWLPRVKEKLGRFGKQENIEVRLEDIKKGIRKMTNWKAPGPDGVQGFWFKRFTSLYPKLAEHLQACMVSSAVPDWMTSGKTALVQKDPKKGNVASNYRPIACLPLMWKLLTCVCSEKVYSHLADKNILPDEQKGCRKRSRGTKDQLLIDKQILEHCKKCQRNLAMGWIDYKKAYDMVPHTWLLEATKMVGIADNILSLLECSMPQWKTQLTCNGDMLGEVKIKRGIFQGDSFSPLLFIIVLIPLSLILNETQIGYNIAGHDKINHLLFMDDLKLYAKNEAELDSLIQTVRIVSDDIGMEFGLEKCAVLILKRGKMSKSQGIELPDGRRMKDVDLVGYKYLGILQMDGTLNREMKVKVKSEYIRRVKKLVNSNLNGGNLVIGMNSWAVGIVRYGAGILDWTQEDLKQLDIKTRKILTMNGSLHPRSNVGRLYMSRRNGGRGMISCEECVKNEEKSLELYVHRSEEWMLRFVATELGLEEAEDMVSYKRAQEERKKEQWQEKALHGKFLKDIDGVGTDRTWEWLKKGQLKKETEGIICAAQEQALRVNSIKVNIDGQDGSPLCRMCGKTNETVQHLVSGCTVLAGTKYMTRHDIVGKQIHWLLLKKYSIPVADKWYQHVPQTVIESCGGDVVIYWDKPIVTDRKVTHNKPDVVVIERKEKKWTIIDFAIPMDHRVKVKEDNKVETYMDLAAEVRRQYRVKTEIVPIVLGALGTIPKRLEDSLGQLGLPDVIASLQKSVLISTAAILRRVLSL